MSGMFFYGTVYERVICCLVGVINDDDDVRL